MRYIETLKLQFNIYTTNKLRLLALRAIRRKTNINHELYLMLPSQLFLSGRWPSIKAGLINNKLNFSTSLDSKLLICKANLQNLFKSNHGIWLKLYHNSSHRINLHTRPLTNWSKFIIYKR